MLVTEALLAIILPDNNAALRADTCILQGIQAPMQANRAAWERARAPMSSMGAFSKLRTTGVQSVPSGGAALVDLWLSWEHGGEAAMRVHVARSANGFAITSGDEVRLGWHGNAGKLGYTAKARGYTASGTLDPLGDLSKALNQTWAGQCAVYRDENWMHNTPVSRYFRVQAGEDVRGPPGGS